MWITVVLGENRLQGGDEGPRGIDLGVITNVELGRAVLVVNGNNLTRLPRWPPPDAATHPLKSKAQWDETEPKSRCQCHACGEREGEGQKSSDVHGNHPSSAMFGAGDDLVGLSIVESKQTIAIAAKYPIRSAAIVISSITLPPVWNVAAKIGEKLCPTSHQRLGEKWNYSRPTSGNPPHRQCGCALSKSGNLAKFTAILRA